MCLKFLCKLLSHYGVPDEIVNFWFGCHIQNKLYVRKYGLSVVTQFQRRSGDILTFIGNTIVTMLALCYAYKYTEAIGGVFGGDDSLVFLPEKMMVPDKSEYIGKVFNLTAKIETYEKSLYFASKFLICVNGYWILIPDPIKHVVRLGRKDIYCG